MQVKLNSRPKIIPQYKLLSAGDFSIQLALCFPHQMALQDLRLHFSMFQLNRYLLVEIISVHNCGNIMTPPSDSGNRKWDWSWIGVIRLLIPPTYYIHAWKEVEFIFNAFAVVGNLFRCLFTSNSQGTWADGIFEHFCGFSVVILGHSKRWNDVFTDFNEVAWKSSKLDFPQDFGGRLWGQVLILQSLHQTVTTRLEEHNCLLCLSMMWR